MLIQKIRVFAGKSWTVHLTTLCDVFECTCYIHPEMGRWTDLFFFFSFFACPKLKLHAINLPGTVNARIKKCASLIVTHKVPWIYIHIKRSLKILKEQEACTLNVKCHYSADIGNASRNIRNRYLIKAAGWDQYCQSVVQQCLGKELTFAQTCTCVSCKGKEVRQNNNLTIVCA